MEKKGLRLHRICFVEAGTGEEALEKYKQLLKKQCRVKLILMDNNMGDRTMSGLETSQALRRFEATKVQYHATHIIAHTSDDPQMLTNNPLYKFMDDISYKPMLAENVVKCLRRFAKKELVRNHASSQFLSTPGGSVQALNKINDRSASLKMDR